MGRKGLQRGISAFLFVCFLFYIAPYAYGSGFAIYTQGASSLGQGAATIAHAEDPTAIFYNPALINKLEGTQIEIGTTLLFPSRQFKSEFSGDIFKAKHDLLYPSTLFIAHKFSDKVSAGLGIFNPFGLKNNWGGDWEGRYITTNSEMRTFNINPVVSYQVTPHITFAAGLDFLLLDALLEKNINLASIVPGLPDGGQKFKGDGKGIGYNVGILLEPHKDIAIGASYRSEIKVDIDGKADHDNIPVFLRPLFPDTNGETDLTLPQQFHAGIYYKGLYPLIFEIGMRYEGWSSYEKLKFEFDQPITGMRTFVYEKDWEDTYSFNLGVKYQLSDTTALLAGYLYGGNPIPDKTFEPSIPDANTHLFSIGTDVKYKSLRFALAYAYQKLQSRSKHNTIDDNPFDVLNPNPATSANGTYHTDIHMVAISLTYKF